MKKVLLLTAIITLVAVLAACTSFVKTDAESNVPSKDETVSTVGTSSDVTVDETGKPADNNSVTDTSSTPSTVGGSESASSTDTSSKTSSNTSSTTSSQGGNTRPSGTSSTTSSQGSNTRPGGDNEGGWSEDWTPNASSSAPETETPVTPPTQDDETTTPPTASTGSDWVDPNGPGWIDGWY